MIEPITQVLQKRGANHTVITNHIIYKVKPTNYPPTAVDNDIGMLEIVIIF